MVTATCIPPALWQWPPGLLAAIVWQGGDPRGPWVQFYPPLDECAVERSAIEEGL